jgi:Peptidase family M48
LIASAREFIADAEAVRLTQNPAALVSALRRIEGRSVIPGLAAGQDAMMIDGAHEGAFATHPTIAERIAAIISVTGSMALIAPAGRDTRPPGLGAGASFGRRVAPALEAAYLQVARQDAGAALGRVSSSEFNRLGLTPELTLGAVAAIGVFLWAHSADLRNPSALAKAFDPGSMRTYFAISKEQARCKMQGVGRATGLVAEKPTGCSPYEMLADHRGKDDIFGKIANALPEVGTDSSTGITYRSNGTFTSVTPPEVKLAEVKRARCFQTSPYSVGDAGLHSVTEQPRGDISLPRYLHQNDQNALGVMEATPAERDRRLLEYFNGRKAFGWVIHRFFGDPGLQLLTARYVAAPEHEQAIAVLRQRLTDPGFATKLSALERAELELLAATPLDFISCTARRVQGPKKA